MARDISFLGGGQEREQQPPPPNGVSDGGFHVPGPPSPKRPSPPPVAAPLPPPPPPPPPSPKEHGGAVPLPPVRRNGTKGGTNGKGAAGATPPRSAVTGAAGSSATPPPRGKEAKGASVPPRQLRRISLLPPELGGAEEDHWWIPVTTIAGIGAAVLLVAVPWVLLRSAIARERHAASAVDRDVVAVQRELDDAASALRAHDARARRASAARGLLDRHLTWAEIFPLIESRTLPGVTYESFAADASGSIAVSATAPSVRTAAEQIAAWRSTPSVRRVEASSVASTVDEVGVTRSVRFDLRITVDPTMFQPSTAQGVPTDTPQPPSGERSVESMP